MSNIHNLNKPITLGFSPCPNDTFMFDALVNGRIDTEGLQFEYILEDVETLNRKAFSEELDVTKISFYAFTQLTQHYALLNAGSALGFACGPLVIARDPNINLATARVGIPGKYTTAHFLFNLFAPQCGEKVEMMFSEIENALLNGSIDAGVIIHENRFTFQDKGLKQVIDLGAFWEQQTKLPIPLGGIVVKKGLAPALTTKIDRLLKASVAHAFAQPQDSIPFVRKHAQEMDERVMAEHIRLYVNDYSLDLGESGKNAVDQLFKKAKSLNLMTAIHENIFIS